MRVRPRRRCEGLVVELLDDPEVLRRKRTSARPRCRSRPTRTATGCSRRLHRLHHCGCDPAHRAGAASAAHQSRRRCPSRHRYRYRHRRRSRRAGSPRRSRCRARRSARPEVPAGCPRSWVARRPGPAGCRRPAGLRRPASSIAVSARSSVVRPRSERASLVATAPAGVVSAAAVAASSRRPTRRRRLSRPRRRRPGRRPWSGLRRLRPPRDPRRRRFLGAPRGPARALPVVPRRFPPRSRRNQVRCSVGLTVRQPARASPLGCGLVGLGGRCGPRNQSRRTSVPLLMTRAPRRRFAGRRRAAPAARHRAQSIARSAGLAAP